MTKKIVIGLLLILVLLDFLNLPSLLKSNATHMLLSAMYNEEDYKDTLFNFNKDEWPKKVQSSKPVPSEVEGFKVQSETPEGVIDFILDNVDITKSINFVGWTAEISPDWVELRRLTRLRVTDKRQKTGEERRDKGQLVTIEVKTTSRLYTYDYSRANAWQLGKVREVGDMWGKKLLKEKEFRELGVIVRFYDQTY